MKQADWKVKFTKELSIDQHEAEEVEHQFSVSYNGFIRILCINAFSKREARNKLRIWCLENNATDLS